MMTVGGVLAIADSFVGCVGDEPSVTGGNPGEDSGDRSDGGVNDAASSNDGSSSSDGGGPGSLTVGVDGDPSRGNVNETLTIRRSTNEANVTAYNLYWGSASGKGAQIASLPKTGADLTNVVIAAIPADATQYLLFTANTDGAETQINTADVRDNYPVFTDIAASTDAGSGPISVAVDSANNKLLVTAVRAGAPGFLRCALGDLTGKSCAFAPFAAASLPTAGFSQPVIDKANARLLLVAADTRAQKGKAEGVFGCGLTDTTGASCDFTYTSVPDASFQESPNAIIDSAGKLYTVSIYRPAAGGDVVNVTKCDLSPAPASCVHQQGALGDSASAAWDSLGGYIDVATVETTNYRPHVYRFSTTSLTFAQDIDISKGGARYSGNSPSLALDLVNQKLLVVAVDNADSDKLVLYRCNLTDPTGASCTKTALSTDQVPANNPQAVIDITNKKLLVVTDNGGNNYKPALFRCELDGTACTYTDLSDGQGINSGATPAVALDVGGQRLYVVTNDGAGSIPRPGLFSIGLW